MIEEILKNSSLSNEILNLIIIIVLVYITIKVLMFLIFRELACWYYKINDIKKLLENIDSNISILVNQNKKEININKTYTKEKEDEPFNEGHNEAITYRNIIIEDNEYENAKNSNSDESEIVVENIVKSQKSLKEILSHKYYISDLFKKKDRD